MESCSAVEKEVDKVLSKLSSFRDRSSVILRNLNSDLESITDKLNEDGNTDDSTYKDVHYGLNSQILPRIKELITKLSTEHRDLHSSVSKVGKAIDKNFTSDFICVNNDNFFDGERQKLMNEVICQHFFREGLLNVADNLVEETGISLEDDAKAPFFELNQIIAALRDKNLKPALEWTQKNREKLAAQKSSLEFKLHRLAYISLLSGSEPKVAEAVAYARNNLTNFVIHHEKSIQTLLGCLMFVKNGLEVSPYSHLLASNQWTEICDIFMRDACALLGLSVESPLAVCVNAGCKALPVLLNIKHVMQQQQVHNMWNTKEELPIEIDLGQTCRYHSIFACPILRQQSTENNPPMRLVCGHIISRDALLKLTTSSKIKCPYCPVEQSPSDATHIYF